MANLYATLKTRAEQAAAALVLPLGWDGQPFTPPHAPHLRGKIVITGTRAASLGSSGLTRSDGRLELLVVTASGDDMLAVDLGNRLAGQFRRGEPLGFDNGTGTLLTPSLTAPSHDGVRMNLSVNVPFYTFQS